MKDLAFYNAGDQGAKGPRQLVVLVRRAVRRLLRPIFLRQVEILQHLVNRLDDLDRLAPRVETHEHAVFALRIDADSLKQRQQEISDRQEQIAEQVETALAFGWDYVALVRRLATLEDQVAALTGTAPSTADEGETHPSILFPGLEKIARKTTPESEGEVRSKVC